ncbi:PASTA domain-containing protein [Mycolicibacterium celeriflavum]|uniref:PASTA domain-containing protein n=1 Tax=Mycolicibacterium celeriflavum TaxID=1249101 RepID=UPI003CEEC408
MLTLRHLLAGATVAAAAAAMALAGAGQAGAVPDVVDRPYKDAKKIIQQYGGNAVVATRVGSSADEGDCLVTNAWDAAVRRPNSRGRPIANSDIMVALNCNGAVAAAGVPGNSAMSPVGRDAKAEQQRQEAKAAREAATKEEQELAAPVTPDN